MENCPHVAVSPRGEIESSSHSLQIPRGVFSEMDAPAAAGRPRRKIPANSWLQTRDQIRSVPHHRVTAVSSSPYKLDILFKIREHAMLLVFVGVRLKAQSKPAILCGTVSPICFTMTTQFQVQLGGRLLKKENVSSVIFLPLPLEQTNTYVRTQQTHTHTVLKFTHTGESQAMPGQTRISRARGSNTPFCFLCLAL